ncbi:MAG: transcriptional regulator, partial [Pseudomonadota bacterium]
RRIFLDPTTRAAQDDWESIARFLVATFRAETARLGEDKRAQALIAELSLMSKEFADMWSDNEVRTTGEGAKVLRHPTAGRMAFEYASFAVDGRPDLKLVTYTPAGEDCARKMRLLLERAGVNCA